MDKTPIQEAIKYWNERMAEAGTAQLRQAAALFVQYLESLLSKEKEFVGKVWEEAILTSHIPDYNDSHIIRDQYKAAFINQLYPEK